MFEIASLCFVVLCLNARVLGLWRCTYTQDDFVLENPNFGYYGNNNYDWRDVRRTNSTPSENVLEVMEKVGLTQMAAYFRQVGLDEVLAGSGPFTIFAPTNYSFTLLDKKIRDNISSDSNYLRRLLQHHVVPGRNRSWDFKPSMCLPTLIDNVSLAISYTWNNRLNVNDAHLLVLDIEAKNGLIHVIEGVLIPPEKTGCPFRDELRQPPIQPLYNGYGGLYNNEQPYYNTPRQGDSPVQYYPWV